MTVTKDASLLCSFRLKIEEAVSYVPRMSASEKLKAVHFWNLISQKLQSIINSNAADINDVAFKTRTDESEKMRLEAETTNTAPHCSISSDFINLQSNYGMSSEVMEQYHSADINSAQLLTSETFSTVSESSLHSIRSISHLNPLNNSISHHSLSSCQRNVNSGCIAVHSLSENSCDTLGTDSSVSAAPRTIETVLSEPIKNEDYVSEVIRHQEIRPTCELSENAFEIHGRSYNLSNNVTYVPHKVVLTKANETSSQDNCDKFSFLEDKLSSELHKSLSCNNQMLSGDSVKSVFKAGVNVEDVDSSHTSSDEPIVSFVVSCSKGVINKNEHTPVINEKCSENYIGRKSLRLKRYTCSDCLAKFATRGGLNVHMRKHTGERPYPCSKCSSSFTTKGNLMRHLKSHTGEKPYTCTRCGGKFTAKKSLNVHMRRHTGEKPYECKECGKRFAQSSILQTHMAMHLNQKIHLCEHCGKSFRQRAQLQTHKLRHENIRKHSCSECSARFLVKGDLERHMRVHTGEKPFVCEICSRAFTRQQTLNEHMNRHYGLRPYICKYCSRTFTEMSSCYKHEKHHERAAANEPQNSQIESSTECLL